MFADYFNLNDDKKELISFVGGGGKTSSIFRLAHELKARGKKVLVTTTTRIFVPEKGDFDELVIKSKPQHDIFNPVPGSITVLGKELLEEGEKLKGIDPFWLDSIFTSGCFDYILVEADGSKQKSIKAPAVHEPVIPSSTTKTVGVIGLSVLNKNVDTEVFRAEIFKKICGDNSVVNLEQIFRLVTSPQGLFKNVPPDSEKYLFLNQLEGEPLKKAAFLLLAMLEKADFYLDGFIAGSIKEGKFYSYPLRQKIAGIIMAAGFSRRMGQDKLLLKLDEGLLLVEKVVKEAAASDLDEVILVYQNPVIQKIGEKYGVKTVFNPDAVKGQSASVQIGIKTCLPEMNGYMFLPGDMPFIDRKLINKLLKVFKNSTFPVIVPFYDGQPGMPTIFSSSLKAELLEITGDEGGRSIIRKNPFRVKKVHIKEVFRGIDIDTPDEWKKYFTEREMDHIVKNSQ